MTYSPYPYPSFKASFRISQQFSAVLKNAHSFVVGVTELVAFYSATDEPVKLLVIDQEYVGWFFETLVSFMFSLPFTGNV